MLLPTAFPPPNTSEASRSVTTTGTQATPSSSAVKKRPAVSSSRIASANPSVTRFRPYRSSHLPRFADEFHSEKPYGGQLAAPAAATSGNSRMAANTCRAVSSNSGGVLSLRSPRFPAIVSTWTFQTSCHT